MQAEALVAEPRRRGASPWQVAKAVASAFFGVRRRSEHESVELKPAAVIVAGLIGAALFVTTLLLIVRWVTS